MLSQYADKYFIKNNGTGLFIIKEREDEKGWAQAPSVVEIHSNYYNRTYRAFSARDHNSVY